MKLAYDRTNPHWAVEFDIALRPKPTINVYNLADRSIAQAELRSARPRDGVDLRFTELYVEPIPGGPRLCLDALTKIVDVDVDQWGSFGSASSPA